MKKIFNPDFQIKFDNFTVKYLNYSDIYSINKYYLSNFSHFKNSMPKRTKDYYSIDNIYLILEQEISFRQQQKGLRLYIIDENYKIKENISVNEYSLELDEFKIIGDISLYDINIQNNYSAISYEIDKDYESKGLMSKIFNNLTKYLTEENTNEIFLKQLVSFVPIDNNKSKEFCLNNKFSYFKTIEKYAEINNEIKDHYVFIKNL